MQIFEGHNREQRAPQSRPQDHPAPALPSLWSYCRRWPVSSRSWQSAGAMDIATASPSRQIRSSMVEMDW